QVAAAGQIEDLLLLHRGIEGPLEVVERLVLAEAGGFQATLELAIGADREFVLEDQLQELAMVQGVALRFLQAHVQTGKQPRQTQLAECGGEGVVHEISFWKEWWMRFAYSDNGRMSGCSFMKSKHGCSTSWRFKS